MADEPEKEPGYRRRRVAKACNTCRQMKSKCDGKQPRCARCIAYGYSCVYLSGKPRRRHQGAGAHPAGPGSSSSATENATPAPVNELRDVIDQYDRLLDRFEKDIQNDAKCDFRSSRIKVRAQAEDILNGLLSTARSRHTAQQVLLAGGHSPTSQPPGSCNQRYLGEVSDVHFFNQVKRLLQARKVSGSDLDFDSYEQNDDRNHAVSAIGRSTELPNFAESAMFAEVYFTTIHIAYPFLPQMLFMRNCENLRTSMDDPNGCPDGTQLALFYVLCAIGAYYTSFPGKDPSSNRLHEVYFQHAAAIAAASPGADRSDDQVVLLLTQCFYYLAVCRTDSCWTTLGQAVRAAQSIGLHIETRGTKSRRLMDAERRRRLWYSIYVLDRLLSLQLGRPPAIHDDDCDVPLPSRCSDSGIDWDADCLPEPNLDPSAGDYFLAVISFSRIVGRVLRDIYSPRKGQPTVEDTFTTREIDRQLVEWKLGLDRRLRFDLGHAFDSSLVYKRQRNMLAVKFHHLRALVHRPYLCYPLLRHRDDGAGSLPQEDWPLVSSYEKTCVLEARETARLLHGVSSEKDLVHDFPWWQMISCLICAGSILLISSIFTQPSTDEHADFDAESLLDDAETCLKMFEALSVNSPSASIARDMMESLKECGSDWKGRSQPAMPFNPSRRPSNSLVTLPSPVEMQTSGMMNTTMQDMDASERMAGLTPGSWPAEIGDSMAWSAHLFGALTGSGPGE